MPSPYYSDALVTLYFGNALQIPDWTVADLIITDPPYGIGWSRGENRKSCSRKHAGILNDVDTSTRDAARRCMGFARDWGYGGIIVGNLYALRATDPTALSTASDPEGPENGLHIRRIGRTCSTVICAWGAHPAARLAAEGVVRLLQTQGARVCCLGTTKAGHPRHPLYVKGDTAPEVYPAVGS